MFKFLKAETVSHRLLSSILLVALIPVSLLTLHLYHAAWENSWREIHEKHQLIAENLASPISIYIDDHRNMLALLAANLSFLDVLAEDRIQTEQRLVAALKNLEGFKALVLMDAEGNILGLAKRGSNNQDLSRHMNKAFAEDETYKTTLQTGKEQLSGVKRSPLDGTPTLVLSYPVSFNNNKERGVLLSELKIEVIEKLRRNVKFGIKGHSAIVDQYGHVIAHPNPDWMEEMRDLSKLSVVKLMMEGKTGVTTFYSPFIKQNMVAGYTSVPGYGWGIMVPQPESEVSAQVRKLMISNFIWGIVGVCLAIVLAIILARWINNPINRLVNASHALLKNNLKGEMEESHDNDPYEVKRLNSVVRSLVSQLQHSRHEVFELNNNLQVKIDEATQQLLESNKQLEMFAKSDHLTSLANRRFFEQELKTIIGQRHDDSQAVCIMLLDIDDFKDNNDKMGHAAGDKILTEIARLLESAMRAQDFVARYAGDEFVLILRCEESIALQRAEQIRKSIEEMEIHWHDVSLKVTVSIGVHSFNVHHERELDLGRIMQKVDAAMYKAKQQGRNRVILTS